MKGIILLICALFLSSCASIRKIGLNETARIFNQASNEINQETNFDWFVASAPGAIKNVEGLLYVSPENEYLLSTAIVAYSGYAYAVYETEMLEATLAKNEALLKQKTDMAKYQYSKAIKYGEKYLKTKGMSLNELMASKDPVEKVLEKKLSKKDVRSIFYIGQAIAGLVNLEKSNVELVGQLPLAKSFVDWSCQKNPLLDNGACYFFNALYEMNRPSILGGKPEEGKLILEKFIKDNPLNLLAQVLYLQYWIIPRGLEDEFKASSENLENEFKEFSALETWSMGASNKFDTAKDINFYNSMAARRFNLIKKYKNNLF